METTRTVIIRQYAPDDFMDIAHLLEEFHAESLKEYGLECEPDQLEKAVEEYKSEGLVLEMDGKIVGLITGKVIDYPLQKAKIFQELIWYVSKNYRKYGLKLLKELEKRCKERGIYTIIMVALGNSMTAKLDRLYRMTGYKLLETHYIKVME